MSDEPAPRIGGEEEPRGMQIVGSVDILDLLRDLYLPEDIKMQLWGLCSQLLALSYIGENEYERFMWKIKYIITLAKCFVEETVDDELALRENIMRLEQLELLALLQLRRSVHGFERRLLSGSAAFSAPQRKGLITRLFGG